MDKVPNRATVSSAHGKKTPVGLRWTCRSRGVRWVSESPLVRNATEMGVLVRSKAIDQFIIPIMRDRQAASRILLASPPSGRSVHHLCVDPHSAPLRLPVSGIRDGATAWRAQHGVTHPDWESYPHVANSTPPEFPGHRAVRVQHRYPRSVPGRPGCFGRLRPGDHCRPRSRTTAKVWQTRRSSAWCSAWEPAPLFAAGVMTVPTRSLNSWD